MTIQLPTNGFLFLWGKEEEAARGREGEIKHPFRTGPPLCVMAPQIMKSGFASSGGGGGGVLAADPHKGKEEEEELLKLP